jgi:lysozyme
MNPSPAATALIKRFEGCEKRMPDGRLKAYPDPGTGGDPWTIGWGSTGPDIRRSTIWTQEQADERLERDVAEFAKGVASAIGTAPTTQAQFDAMVSFAYNVGLSAFAKSTLLRKHRAGDYDGAAGQFALWNKAGGRVLAGLVKRRTAEARCYRGLPA